MLLRRCPDRRNRTGEIVEALRTAPDGSVIRFEPGIYDFFADDAFSGYFCPSCNKSSDKKVIFPVLRKKNITLDGGGAEFIFHDRVFPFIIQDSVGVTLENFSVDFSFQRCVICDVQTVGEDGICLSIDRAKYDYRTNEEGNLLIRAGNDEFSTCERRFFLKQGTRGNTDCCYLSAGEIFYDNDNLPAEVFYCYAEETDGGVFLRRDGRSGFSPRFTAGAELLLSYDEQRDNDVFFFDRSENITVRNVSIHSGAGMGFVGQCCRDLTLESCVISPRSEGFSTTADGILLTNFSGRVRIENCVVRNTMDDAVSVHGYYTTVERITAPRKAILRMRHRSQSFMNPYCPGDRLVVTDGKSMNEKDAITLKSARYENDPYLIYADFDEDIRGRLRPGDLIEDPERTPETLITGCLFENACAVRLGSAGKTVFENNRMLNCSGLLVNDIMSWWYASGPTKDVTIRGNVFDGCGISAFVDRGMPCEVRHKLIRITDNEFKNGAAISVRNTEKLVLSGNSTDKAELPVVTDGKVTVMEE